MTGQGEDRAVLWHLAMSHYNEKVRWALDLKRFPHMRRAALPGVHQAVARRLTGGLTLPVLVLDGRAIGESARIVAELDRLVPDPPLLPADAGLRAEAARLEREFDEVLAPALRIALYQEALEDSRYLARFLSVGGPPSRARLLDLLAPALVPLLRRNFRVPDRSDPGPRDEIRRQVERIGGIVSSGGFLVGDSFTVADLAACSFLIPFVDMEAMPGEMPGLPHALGDFGRELAATPAGAWVVDTYRRFRTAP